MNDELYNNAVYYAKKAKQYRAEAKRLKAGGCPKRENGELGLRYGQCIHLAAKSEWEVVWISVRIEVQAQRNAERSAAV